MRRQLLAMRAEASTDKTGEETRGLINTLYGNVPDRSSYPDGFRLPEERVTVVALNDAAITALGTAVAVSRLLPATEDDLTP